MPPKSKSPPVETLREPPSRREMLQRIGLAVRPHRGDRRARQVALGQGRLRPAPRRGPAPGPRLPRQVRPGLLDMAIARGKPDAREGRGHPGAARPRGARGDGRHAAVRLARRRRRHQAQHRLGPHAAARREHQPAGGRGGGEGLLRRWGQASGRDRRLVQRAVALFPAVGHLERRVRDGRRGDPPERAPLPHHAPPRRRARRVARLHAAGERRQGHQPARSPSTTTSPSTPPP